MNVAGIPGILAEIQFDWSKAVAVRARDKNGIAHEAPEKCHKLLVTLGMLYRNVIQ